MSGTNNSVMKAIPTIRGMLICKASWIPRALSAVHQRSESQTNANHTAQRR